VALTCRESRSAQRIGCDRLDLEPEATVVILLHRVIGMLKECNLVPRARRIEGWPRLMPEATAAAYCGAASVEAFLRGVGNIWPRPKNVTGMGERWLRDDLDDAIDQLMTSKIRDAADLL